MSRPWLRTLRNLVILGVLLLGGAIYLSYPGAARPRYNKAQADTAAIASAVSGYERHTGMLPSALTALTIPVTNSAGAVSGPFMSMVPNAPAGWTPYAYESRTDGDFQITTSGEGRTVTADRRTVTTTKDR